MFLTWTADMTTALLSNVTGIINDLSPLLIVIVGVGIGLIVFHAIVSAIRGH